MTKEWKHTPLPADYYFPGIGDEYLITKDMLDPKIFENQEEQINPDNYYTKNDADSRFQPTGNYLTSIPSEYLTQDEADNRYQPVGNYLTEIPAEYLTQSEGDTRYLQANKAANQPHSTATDVAGLVTDFNSLIDKLIASGQMLSS